MKNRGRRQHKRHPFGEQSYVFGWNRKTAIKKERRNAQRGRRERDIWSVTSQGKRNIKGGEGKISPNKFSKKVGNLQGSNFSKEPVAKARLQGVSE